MHYHLDINFDAEPETELTKEEIIDSIFNKLRLVPEGVVIDIEDLKVEIS